MAIYMYIDINFTNDKRNEKKNQLIKHESNKKS